MFSTVNHFKTALKGSFRTLPTGFLVFSSILYFAFSSEGFAYKHTVTVNGWFLPNFSETAFPYEIGSDPLLGRLACPALSRLNLAREKSEPLILSSVKQAGKTWDLELRTGIYWWNQTEATSTDLDRFLKKHLKVIVEKKGLGKWKIPKFETTIKNKYKLMVTWSEQPKFGPYVLNEISFFRQKDGSPSFECVGLYQISKEKSDIVLTPNKSYQLPIRPDLKISDHFDPKRPYLELRKASSFGATPWTRYSDERISCSKKIPLPLLSVIYWNTQKPLTGNAEIRKLFTKLTPRGDYYRSFAGYLGDLISGPIMRIHPGYNKSIYVRSYEVRKAADALKRLGYVRKGIDFPLMDKNKQPINIKIHRIGKSSQIVEKTIEDTFSLVGIKVQFVESSLSSDHSDADGILTGIWLDWPSNDLASEFHSNSKQSLFPWNIEDKVLDQLLESYSISLTKEKPDFRILQKIHSKLYEQEPISVLMQHDACMKWGGGFTPGTLSIDTKNPDWVRRLIL